MKTEENRPQQPLSVYLIFYDAGTALGVWAKELAGRGVERLADSQVKCFRADVDGPVLRRSL